MENYVEKNIEDIRSEINDPDILIVAVSKTVSCDIAKLAYDIDNVELGENRVQEFLRKYEYFKGDKRMHFIGHLQKNKVKYLTGKKVLIHSVDSMELLDEIQKRSAMSQSITEILIQIKLFDEETKFGASEKLAREIIEKNEKNANVKIKGLMTMAPFTDNEQLISDIFRKLYNIFIDIQNNTFYNTDMVHLSMGMSNDYALAVKEGANVLRIGQAIFKKKP